MSRGATARKALWLVFAFALLIRIVTVGGQSFWLDEAYTSEVVNGSLARVWDQVPRTENTPPLYYLCVWFWAQLFGHGDVALRSLSTLAGALAVFPVFALTRRVVRLREFPEDGQAYGAKAALIAALLWAVNPLSHWFSQEARTYALTALLGAIALWAFVAALQERTARRYLIWAVSAAALTWAHYFGGFLLVCGSVALVVGAVRMPERKVQLRRLSIPLLLAFVACIPLASVAEAQRKLGKASGIGEEPLGERIAKLFKQPTVGFNGPMEQLAGVLLIVFWLALVLVALWARKRGRNYARSLAAVSVASLLSPFLLILVNDDYVTARNALMLLPALIALVAVGLTLVKPKFGAVALALTVTIQLGFIAAVGADARYQRDDWRGVVKQLRSGSTPQLIFTEDFQEIAYRRYRSGARVLRLGPEGIAVRSVALLDRQPDNKHPAPELLSKQPAAPAPGMRLTKTARTARYRIYLWQSASPVKVNVRQLGTLPDARARTAVLQP